MTSTIKYPIILFVRNNIELETIKRFKGCLVGAAVGDALGAPVEFKSASEIELEYGGKLKEMVGGGYFNWRAGQTTDDTDMSMAIVDSVVKNGRYVPEDIASRFVAWMQRGPRDIGGMTKAGLLAIASGADFRDSGRLILPRFNTAPNGSIMRTAPIGLIFRGQPEMLMQAAGEVSAMTHAHPECLLACRMTPFLIADLVSGVSRDQALEMLRQRFQSDQKAQHMINDALQGKYYRDVYQGGGYVFESFNIALNAFMSFDNFEDTLVYAVNLGGDTDTQATVAGAFAGAFYGVDSIPGRWKSKLNPFSAAEIEEKARKLYLLNQSS